MIADWWYLQELFCTVSPLIFVDGIISHCLDIIIFFDVLSTHAGGNDNIQQKRSCIFNLGIFCLLATHQVYSLKSIALNFISISWIARVKIIHLIENHFAKIKTRLEYVDHSFIRDKCNTINETHQSLTITVEWNYKSCISLLPSSNVLCVSLTHSTLNVLRAAHSDYLVKVINSFQDSLIKDRSKCFIELA